MTQSFQHHLRVRYGECDPQGIVFNANYLLYVDVAFTELTRAAFGAWSEMTDRGYDAVVADVALRFRAPARFDDELEVAMQIARLGRSSIETAVAMRRGGDELVTGTIRHAVVSAETWTSVEMPDFIRDGLGRYSLPS